MNGNDPGEVQAAPSKKGAVDVALNPTSIFTKMVTVQDYEQDTYLSFIINLLGKDKIDVVPFEYIASKETNRASMSLHLTERDKIDVINAFYLPDNQASLQKVKELLR